ncbi:hypothetical protein KC675_00765 [Candidatus Dojkabacteria bacterium]|jgi:hypothetical protein|uniref:Uncharacterized protein n=1 Tax=Candidatus Dojkabacteria bacterium TaxID=2099670 RepID=A0A955I864_9BACT|nr:hypothetical protein [Candidatus Dojkabacteria bacterium]
MNEIPKESKLKPIGRILVGIASGYFFGTLLDGEPNSANAVLLATASIVPLFFSKLMKYRFDIGDQEPIGSENLKYMGNGCSDKFRTTLQLGAGLMMSPAVEKWGSDVFQMAIRIIN